MDTHSERIYHLNSLSELELQHVEAKLVSYGGRHAVRIIEQEGLTAHARMPHKICAASSALPSTYNHTGHALSASS